LQTQFTSLELRQAFSSFPTGVTVITGLSSDKKPIGITVSSFNTVSLSPPLILWSIGKQSVLKNCFGVGQRQLIHVLETNQKDLALIFAKQIKKNILELNHSISSSGLYRLADCAAYYECETIAVHEGGDHQIIVARVIAIEHDPHLQPLLFAHSQFTQLAFDPEGSL
jgi:flavin reductase (DIM6/NTAB) family NADH-FMN oxidoreductase RutF